MDFLVVSLPTSPGLPESAAELVAGTRPLADRSGGTVSVVILGRDIVEASRQAATCGADRVYLVESNDLAEYEADLYLQALECLTLETRPGAVLFSADPFTAELAPRLASRLRTGVATGCTSFSLIQEPTIAAPGQTEILAFIRPVYGGKALAETVITRVPAIATVARRSFQPLSPGNSRKADLLRRAFSAEARTRRTRVLRVEQEDDEGTRLEDARIIVSGGRGLGEPGGLRYLEELAALLGGKVAVSRPPVDLGWAPPSRQVGQTGKTVAPDLYLAVGISGASQHLAGMGRAKHVVVVNTDPEAPFFRYAEVGVVADYKRLLPLLVKRLRALLTQR